MSNEMFERVLKQLKDFDDPINVIQLFCLGEPIIRRILYIQEKGQQTGCSSGSKPYAGYFDFRRIGGIMDYPMR